MRFQGQKFMGEEEWGPTGPDVAADPPAGTGHGAGTLRLLVLGGLSVGSVVPLLVSEYWLFVTTEILILALFAASFNLLLGYGGMLSLGHAAPFGLGTYAVALLATRAGVTSLPVTIGVGLLVAVLAGWVIGFFAVRASRVFFTMLTLAFAQMFFALASRWYAVTGGDTGIPGLPRATLAGFVLESRVAYYYVVLGVVAVGLWLLWRVVHSPFGLVVTAIRENPRRTRYLGLSVSRYQLAAFVIGWAFAGVAGALWGWNQRAAFPDTLEWGRSAEVLVMTILGGQGSFVGPILGAGIFTVLQTLFNRAFEEWALFLGLIVIAVTFLFPNGLTGLYTDWQRRRRQDAAGQFTGARRSRGA